MKKGFSSKYGVAQLTMHAFFRAVGVSCQGSKINHRIYSAFMLHGRRVPNGASLTEFCKANADFIREKAGTHRPPKAAKVVHEVAKDAFLLTFEWRRVRMQALKKYGARCQCCGASPADGAVMNVDHIKPRKLFPALALDVDNLQILCNECNHGKGNWDMTDWRPPIEANDGVERYDLEFLRS